MELEVLREQDDPDQPGQHRVDAHEHPEEPGGDEPQRDQVGRVRHDRRQDPGRLQTALLGTEERYAAVAADDPLARRRTLRPGDFADRTVAVDSLTGTTSEELWSPGAAPAGTRTVRGIEDWLTVIAAGQAIGMSSEATAAQHRRPGVVYRPVLDAPPVPVWLAWWADSPPAQLEPLVRLMRTQYARAPQPGRSARR